jgi:predicted nucleotide-binding protein (sugar kinase/HSP70/actin superfamily)
MTAIQDDGFRSISENFDSFKPGGKQVLIPEMNRAGAHLLAAALRSYDISARVLETYKGLDLGREYTSGKECYPCQVTMGDILSFVKEEKEKLGPDFNPENYSYFMPESDGPCRFGMYNKYQKIVLDSISGLDKLKICSLTTRKGYSVAGVVEEGSDRDFRKTLYLSVIVADILNRLLWRIRPYEKNPGTTDSFIEESMHEMASAFEAYGAAKNYDAILNNLEDIVRRGKELIDQQIPRKPRIGIVGEIYLRMHTRSNQDLIKTLEKYGAEVTCASLAEWINFVSYIEKRTAVKNLSVNLKQRRFTVFNANVKKYITSGLDLLYQQWQQKNVYQRVLSILDISEDHKVGHLEDILRQEDIFSFDIDTEACLSIAGILEYVRSGYSGTVNVYPFTCMPGMTTSAIARPIMTKMGVPYLDAAYDSSIQPGREGAIRTFMYQAYQYHENLKNEAGRKSDTAELTTAHSV